MEVPIVFAHRHISPSDCGLGKKYSFHFLGCSLFVFFVDEHSGGHLHHYHNRFISFARHFFALYPIWAMSHLRDIAIARHPICVACHLCVISTARHPICATFHLRDIPLGDISTALHPICATSPLRFFLPFESLDELVKYDQS